jgi:hypothetical protein
VHLLTLQHLVELLLATVKQELAEVHLGVLSVVKLLEEAHAQPDVRFQVLSLSGTLHENDLHQLLQKGRVVVEAGHQLVLDFIEVFLRDLVEKHAQLAYLGGEFVVRVLLRSVQIQTRLVQFNLSLLVRQHQQGHVVRSCFARRPQRQHKLN